MDTRLELRIFYVCLAIMVGLAIWSSLNDDAIPINGIGNESEQKEDEESPDGNGEESQPDPNGAEQEPEYAWGLDTASIVDERFYQCVVDNYGEPVAFGRYLETKEDVSHGLTAEEAEFLHDQGIKIIPIYNHFVDGTSYEKGVAEAEMAITYAEELGIPEDVYIFANVEPEYPIDADFLMGWIETLEPSPYQPGVYGISEEGSDLATALEQVFEEDLDTDVAIWHSSSPYIGITTQEEAPDFKPEVPSFLEVDIWQYGIDDEICNIDTNLINTSILEYLW